MNPQLVNLNFNEMCKSIKTWRNHVKEEYYERHKKTSDPFKKTICLILETYKHEPPFMKSVLASIHADIYVPMVNGQSIDPAILNQKRF